jgi:hypothetical protein
MYKLKMQGRGAGGKGSGKEDGNERHKPGSDGKRIEIGQQDPVVGIE